MVNENFSFGNGQVQHEEPNNNKSSPLEVATRNSPGKKSVLRSMVGAAAVVVGAMTATAPKTAEASAGSIDMAAVPGFQMLQTQLDGLGVGKLSVSLGLGLTLNAGNQRVLVDGKGTPTEKLSKFLEGVTGLQFMRELERQNTRKEGVVDELMTSHGPATVSISSYAQVVLAQNGVSYKNGILSNGARNFVLTGEGSDTPAIECIVTGSPKAFLDTIVASCKQMRITGGKPSLHKVSYSINTGNLEVVPIEK